MRSVGLAILLATAARMCGIRLSGTAASAVPAGIAEDRASSAGRSMRCQCPRVLNSGVEVPSAISGSISPNIGSSPAARGAAAAAASPSSLKPRARRSAGRTCTGAAPGAPWPLGSRAEGTSAPSNVHPRSGALEVERRRPGRRAELGHLEVGGQRGTGVAEHVRERRDQVLVVGRPQVASRPQGRLDLGQHAVVREEAVERDVDLVGRGRQVRDRALHEGAPDARLG